MNEKLNQYLNGVFAPYDGVKSVAELKADLLADLPFEDAPTGLEILSSCEARGKIVVEMTEQGGSRQVG